MLRLKSPGRYAARLIRAGKRYMGLDCCAEGLAEEVGLPKVLIVGSPNVGKSLLFNRLTGQYVTVSNYPGTTVDVSRGHLVTRQGRFEVIDTPGMYSFCPITAEEKVSCALLLNQPAHAVVHVIDAKNIERMLGLTLQMAEAGLPLIVALNMADEARDLGIRIDARRLQERLGVPVIETVATTRQGVRELVRKIVRAQPARGVQVNYGPRLDTMVARAAGVVGNTSHIAPRTRALLLLQEEGTEAEGFFHVDAAQREQVARVARDARRRLKHSIHYHATLALAGEVRRALDGAVTFPSAADRTFRERLSRRLMRPLTGVPVLLLVLYFGLYKFVGVFGAGTLVDFLQETLFGRHITPVVERIVNATIPWAVARELFIGQYGIVTLGIRYAIAIILPVVGTFFIAFSILEDSGYLPRMAMLMDRLMKKIGLNGRAVIPLVLGFGCDTMATMVTRTLETRREKTIATMLLALTIPCSAQLGVILGLLGSRPAALATWAGVITALFLLVGVLMARLLPGEGPSFYMELPPLRLPRVGNVLVKTYTRMAWYFKEVFPLFILASVLIWIGNITGLFQLLVKGMTPVVNWLGLPDGAAVAFLFGFFRRDYGAAGLYDLQKTGALTGNQVTIAAITLTLFLPCIAQLLIMKKERGVKSTLLMSAVVVGMAFGVGFLTNLLFRVLGVNL